MNHRERQFMQHLRAGGWVKAHEAPATGPRLIHNLLAKGWVERRSIGERSVLPNPGCRPRCQKGKSSDVFNSAFQTVKNHREVSFVFKREESQS